MEIFHTVQKSELKEGDHIYAWMAGWTYAHHGIVVAISSCQANCAHLRNCCSVVHYAPSKSEDGVETVAEVRITPLSVFSRNRPLSRCKYGATPLEMRIKRAGTCTGEESDMQHRVVLRALCLVGWGSGQYNLMTRNCEVICRWCKLGTRKDLEDPRVGRGSLLGQSDLSRFAPVVALLSQMTPATAAVVAGAVATTVGAVAIADHVITNRSPIPFDAEHPHDHSRHIPGILTELLCSLDVTLPPEVAMVFLNDSQSAVVFADVLCGSLEKSGLAGARSGRGYNLRGSARRSDSLRGAVIAPALSDQLPSDATPASASTTHPAAATEDLRKSQSMSALPTSVSAVYSPVGDAMAMRAVITDLSTALLN